MKFRVLSDSSCDITKEQEERYHIGIIPYYVSMDGVHYKKDRVEITAEEFYREMAAFIQKPPPPRRWISIISFCPMQRQASRCFISI